MQLWYQAEGRESLVLERCGFTAGSSTAASEGGAAVLTVTSVGESALERAFLTQDGEKKPLHLLGWYPATKDGNPLTL